jgi:hypothetical protein
MKSWICIRIKVKIQKLKKLKIESWRPVDAQNEAPAGNPMTLKRSKIQFRFEVKSWIRISIKVKS